MQATFLLIYILSLPSLHNKLPIIKFTHYMRFELYNYKNRWKVALLFVAVLIAIGTLWYTETFLKQLCNESASIAATNMLIFKVFMFFLSGFQYASTFVRKKSFKTQKYLSLCFLP